MNSRLLRPCICLLVVGASSLVCFALSKIYDNTERFENPDMPPELVSAINENRRVFGYSRYPETKFYFEGKAAEVNGCLLLLSKAEGLSLSVCFVPEAGAVTKSSFVAPGVRHATRDAIRYNWSIEIEELRAARVESQPVESDKWPRWWVTVRVHLADGLRLEEVELPVQFWAKIGGQLSEFVEGHNARREETWEGSGVVASTRPTTLKVLGEGGLFGSGPSPAVSMPASGPSPATQGGEGNDLPPTRAE